MCVTCPANLKELEKYPSDSLQASILIIKERPLAYFSANKAVTVKSTKLPS